MPFHFGPIKRLARKPEPKIFVIGFNKCGTKSLHWFFRANGLRSAHSGYRPRGEWGRRKIATRMRDNLAAGRSILAGLEHYQVLSDMITLTDREVIEANTWFVEMQEARPDAFFIFNDRPVEDWVASRLGHEGGPGGSFVGRYETVTGLDRASVMRLWAEQYADHKARVLHHFDGHPRFLHFDITRDGPDDLATFLDGAVRVDPRLWAHRGSAAERARRYRLHRS